MRAASAILLLLLLSPTEALAHPHDVEPEQGADVGAEEAEPRNIVGFQAAYEWHGLEENRSATTGAPEVEHFGGFIISYERVLIPEWLIFEFAKPFLFNKGGFDSPMDLLLKVPFRFGDFELVAGAGMNLNFRVFDEDRAAEEGTEHETSVGIAVHVGAGYSISRHWALVAHCTFTYIPSPDVVEFELTPSLGVSYLY